MPYFFIDKYSCTGDNIYEFFKIREKVMKVYREFTKSIGASDYLISNYNNRIAGFRFTSKDGAYSFVSERDFDAPKGLRFNKSHSFWVPRLSTKEGKLLLAKMEELPYIGYGKLNEVFGLPADNMPCVNKIKTTTEDSGWVVFIGDMFNTIDTLNDDCIEIKKSKYYRLIGE